MPQAVLRLIFSKETTSACHYIAFLRFPQERACTEKRQIPQDLPLFCAEGLFYFAKRSMQAKHCSTIFSMISFTGSTSCTRPTLWPMVRMPSSRSPVSKACFM